ncbi:MAG: glycosyltransferase [Kofleriaceae bacterium]
MAIPIGFLRHNFLGRSETFIYNSMCALEAGGSYAVRVLALRRVLSERFPWTDVTELGMLSRWLYRVTRLAPAFTRWARSVRLIHAQLGQAGPFAMAGAAVAGVPFVVSYYGHDVVLHHSNERFQPFAWWYGLLRRRMFTRAAKIIVLSEAMRRALIAQGCSPDKLAIVRLGVDLDRFDVARSPHRGPLRILMVGREVDKKGFDDGLRACRALQDRGTPCTVTLLGSEGPLARKLRELARELRLEVSWLDPASSVVEAMARADVLLVPSRRAADGDEEGTPTVIVEGSAARLPIVSTRHAGIPEQVADRVTGYLADERDPAGLAAALERLARDPDHRSALGAAGREHMQRSYSLAAHRARLEAIYTTAIEEYAR